VLTFTYLSSWLILPPLAFHILLHATVSAMDYTLNVVSKRCLVFIFKHSWAPKRSWKISRGGPGKSLEKSWIFFQWKSGNPVNVIYTPLKVHSVGYNYYVACHHLAVISYLLTNLRNSERIWTYSRSRSSKLIDRGANRKRIWDFVLVLIVTMNVSVAVFEILTQKARKLLVFPTRLAWLPPLRWTR